jgi:hypothetical protein
MNCTVWDLERKDLPLFSHLLSYFAVFHVVLRVVLYVHECARVYTHTPEPEQSAPR